MLKARHRGLRFSLVAAAVSLIATIAGCGGDSSGPVVAIQQNSVVEGDFNGDGRLDIAVTRAISSDGNIQPGQVEVFLQNAAPPGSFFRQALYEVGADPFKVATADLNGDGLADLVTANASSDSISVLLNNPSSPGTFIPAVDYATGPGPLSVAIGDLNRDGLPDIAVAVADGVEILLQDPAARGTFLAPLFLAVDGGTFAVAVGDLDGDGIPDLAASTILNANGIPDPAASSVQSIAVFFQDPLNPGNFLQANFSAGLQPNEIAIADIDSDGLLDMAVANIGSPVNGSGSTVSILIQDPLVAGNFLPARNFATPSGTHGLAIGDLDLDGFPDLVVASTVIQSSNPGVVSVFFQDPVFGNFVFSASYADGFTPLSVAIGDLNADGRPDIAVQDGPSILFQDPINLGIFLNEVVIGP